MCGRVTLARPLDALAELFDAAASPVLAGSYAPSWNIAPTCPVVGLAGTDPGGRELDYYVWGLRGRFFNARAETITSNGIFAPAVRQRRLAVIADGFYEWEKVDGGRRPFLFRRADGCPLALAGLWEPWRGEVPAASAAATSGRTGPLRAATVVTTGAGPDIEGVHDRMPAVLGPAELDEWLSAGALGPAELSGLVRPAPAGTLVRYRVSPRVGDARNDGPGLVEPYDEPDGPEALRLFG